MPAWEAVCLIAEHAAGRLVPARESPLVGRVEELAAVETLYERVIEEETPHLITLVGEAGVGKSRLLRELEQRLDAHPTQPAFRTGRSLRYGSGTVFWALGEVLRAEVGIVDSDTADEAWGKLSGYVREAADSSDLAAGDRQAALIGRLLGVDSPPELTSDEDDPERLREAFFSALRSGVEAIARRRPMVIAFEDIHWADDGMLEAIEHLAQWVRAPLMLLCLARDELLDRRPNWGGDHGSATRLLLAPLSSSQTHELVAALVPEGHEVLPAVVERSGGNPLFAEEMARRIAEDGGQGTQLPDTVQGVLAARLDSLEPFERRLVQQAAVVGRTFWQASLVPLAEAEGRDLDSALDTLQAKDILAPASERRLAGERELAFKHVLIRDVAYSMLPKSVRSRKHFEVGAFIEARAGDRTDEVVPLLAEHYGRAAALGKEGDVSAERAVGHARSRGALPRGGRRRCRPALLEPRGRRALPPRPPGRAAWATIRRAAVPAPTTDQVLVRVGEKLGDVSLRLGRVDEAIAVWGECLEWHRGQEDLERVADLHRRIGAGLSHKGERKAAIEHYQKGINLLKDGPPRIELVRLYEEAAWLYLHTGDNMLAIYASEKALRLAERLGETRAASRAHGIFGRVFGRIGDTEKARQNLERAVELARGSDHGETILALSALGRHLEISEADVRGAREAYEEALALAEEVGMLPAQVELHAWLAQLAVYGADWPRVESSTEASAALAEREGLVGKLSLPNALAGTAALARGANRRGDRALSPRARPGRAGGLVRARLPGAVRPGHGAARPGRPRRRHGRAGSGHRGLRARRADRAVDPGHGRPVGDPGPGPPSAGRARGGRAHRADVSAAALSARQRRGPGGAGRRGPGPLGGGGAARSGGSGLGGARPAPGGRPLPAAGRPDPAPQRSPAGSRAAGGGSRRERTPGRPPPGGEGAGGGGLSARYWRSAPVITTTVASPARPCVAGSIGSRWGIPSRRPTAEASRSLPFA